MTAYNKSGRLATFISVVEAALHRGGFRLKTIKRPGCLLRSESQAARRHKTGQEVRSDVLEGVRTLLFDEKKS